MIYLVKCYSRTVVQIAMIVFTLHASQAGGQQRISEAVDRFPTSAESVTDIIVRPVRTYVQWKDDKYDVDPGIDILMKVVHDSNSTVDERHWALLRLVMLESHLLGHDCIDDLDHLYNASADLHKGTILLCFNASRDPRGIPIFQRVLNTEENVKLRLYAANGLALWNIQRGVAELVDLIDSEKKLPAPAGRLPYVRDNALQNFRSKNTHKGWGFPEEKIRKSIYNRADLDDDQKRTKYNKDIRIEIKKWFAENKHRFPDWRIGDPLPKVEQRDKSD